MNTTERTERRLKVIYPIRDELDATITMIMERHKGDLRPDRTSIEGELYSEREYQLVESFDDSAAQALGQRVFNVFLPGDAMKPNEQCSVEVAKTVGTTTSVLFSKSHRAK